MGKGAIPLRRNANDRRRKKKAREKRQAAERGEARRASGEPAA